MVAWKLALAASMAAALTACAGGSRDRDVNPRDPIRAIISADALVFTTWDTDNDLSVTREEMEAGLGREFARADSNNDGAVSPIEFQTWSTYALGGGQMGPYRLDFDRNVDNSITREEFDAELRARFADYDEDDNGAVSRAEMTRLVGAARTPRIPRQR